MRPLALLLLLLAGCSAPAPQLTPSAPVKAAARPIAQSSAKARSPRPADPGPQPGYSQSANFLPTQPAAVDKTLVVKGQTLRQRVVTDPESGLTVTVHLP